jgi:hypothetical protein
MVKPSKSVEEPPEVLLKASGEGFSFIFYYY